MDLSDDLKVFCSEYYATVSSILTTAASTRLMILRWASFIRRITSLSQAAPQQAAARTHVNK